MSYMVMETNRAYAVVLDEAGRFLKAANLSYEVGDTLEELIPLRTPRSKPGSRARIMSLLAAAACFAALMFGAYQQNCAVCGTVRVRINPDLLLSVSRSERVLKLEGLNADGGELIAGYDYRGKRQDVVTAELVERAADMGYVRDGGQVSVTLSGEAEWQRSAEEAIACRLESAVSDVSVTVYLGPAEDSASCSTVRTAPESDYWRDLPVGEPSASPFAYFGQEADQFAAEAGERLGQFGEQTGQLIEDFGTRLGELGEQLGALGEQAGRQIDEALDDGQYWSGVVQDVLDPGGVEGIVNEIIGLF